MPIDPITGYVTSNGTERQLIVAAQQNQRLQDARSPLSVGGNASSGYVGNSSDGALFVLGGMAIALCFMLSLVKWAASAFLSGNGSLLRGLIGVVALCFSFCLARAIFKDTLSFVRKHPLAVAVIIGLGCWAYYAIVPHHAPLQASQQQTIPPQQSPKPHHRHK